MAAEVKRRRRTTWLLPAAVALGFGMLSLGAHTLWREHRLPAAVRAALPEPGRNRDVPSALAARLDEAHATIVAESDREWRGGVADLGRLYHANGRRPEAERCWRVLHEVEPAEARWCYYLADLRRAAGDTRAMATWLERTVERAPDYAPAWLNLGDHRFKAGDFTGAAEAFHRRLALLPGDSHARLGLARLARQAGDDAGARQQLEELVRDVPDFPPALNLLAELRAETGDEHAARDLRWRGHQAGRFLEAPDPWLTELNEWCYDFGRLCVLGTIAYDQREGDRGVSLLRRAITLEPDNPAGYEILAGIFQKLGDHARARATLEEGLRRPTLGAPSAMYYFRLSDARRVLQQPGAALEVARNGLQRVGDSHELRNAAGMALGDLQRYEEAIVEFRAARELDPNNVNTNFNLAFALLNRGAREEAATYLQHILTVEPQHRRALEILGRLAVENGAEPDAVRYFSSLLEAYPGDSAVRSLVADWRRHAAFVADAAGNATEAEAHFRAGLELRREDVEMNAGLGVLLLTQGRFHDALPYLEHVYQVRPHDAQAALHVGQAYAQVSRLQEARRLLQEAQHLATAAGQADLAAQAEDLLRQLPQ